MGTRYRPPHAGVGGLLAGAVLAGCGGDETADPGEGAEVRERLNQVREELGVGSEYVTAADLEDEWPLAVDGGDQRLAD